MEGNALPCPSDQTNDVGIGRYRAYFDLLWTQVRSNSRPLSLWERVRVRAYMSNVVPDQFGIRSNLFDELFNRMTFVYGTTAVGTAGIAFEDQLTAEAVTEGIRLTDLPSA